MDKLNTLRAMQREIEAIRKATAERNRRHARRFKSLVRDRGYNPYANPAGMVSP